MYKRMTVVELLQLHSKTYNYLTVCKQIINCKSNNSCKKEILETF